MSAGMSMMAVSTKKTKMSLMAIMALMKPAPGMSNESSHLIPASITLVISISLIASMMGYSRGAHVLEIREFFFGKFLQAHDASALHSFEDRETGLGTCFQHVNGWFAHRFDRFHAQHVPTDAQDLEGVLNFGYIPRSYYLRYLTDIRTHLCGIM